MAELIHSDTDHQQDIKYEEPEAPVEFGGQYDTKPSMDMNISPKLVSDMDFNMSGITTMDLSTEELCEKGDNQNTEKGEGDSTNQDVDLNKSDSSPPKKQKSFLMSVPLDDISMDSTKMTDSVMSISTNSSIQGSTSSGKKSPNTEKSDAAKKDKERDREERIKAQREKLAEERQKKIEEMREQQRLAQEKRERQLDLRRLKIEELRRRDEERRLAVEDRRRKRDETEQARKESIIQKSQERITRYEQWKASGRKGGRVLVYGFGSRTPREVCQPVDRRRSSSHSALIRRSPNGSDSDSWRPQRRAVSACSTVRRHCCIDINRLTGYPGSSPPSKLLSASTGALYHSSKRDFSSSGNLSVRGRPAESLLVLNSIPEAGPTKRSRSFLAPSGTPPTRPKSTMNLSTKENVRLRDPKTTPRKPRPASIAGSVPSFISVESPKGTSRSKSTDRLARDRQKTPLRSTPKREKDEQNLQEKKDKKGSSVDIRKLTERRKAELQKLAEKKKDAKEDSGSDHEKTPERSTSRVSQQSIDRLSTPRIAKYKNETPTKTDTVKDRVTPSRERAATPTQTKGTKKSVTIVAPQSSPKKTKTPKQKDKENKEPLKRKLSSKESSTEALDSPRASPKPTKDVKVDTRAQSETEAPEELAKVTSPRSVSPASSKSEDEEKSVPVPKKTPEKVVKIVEPNEETTPSTPAQSKPSAPSTPATPASAPKSKKEIEMDEYKAKLAEKRRQAREKAEKEAELERQRLEAIRLAEEERQRQEEEEQRRMEEEASRLAQEARKNEEERLRKAIEAEELRKKEEAERLEQERKQKEEADRKAKEEAERMEREKQEKAKKDEEERLERKKRLEMIMKRVKSDSPMTGSMTSSMIGTSSSMSGSQIGSMTGSMSSSMILIGSDKGDSPYQSLSNSPSKNSLQSNEGGEDSADEANGLDDKSDDKPKTMLQSATDTPKFKSPLLQKLVESKSQNGGSETPKFKSPLLQNLMGKKRLGMDKTEDKTNDVTTNGNKQEEPVEQREESGSERVTEGEKGQVDFMVIADNGSERSESRNSKSDGSVDSDTSTAKDVSLAEQKLGSNTVIIKTEVSSSSLNGVSQNGEMEQYPQELVDSSISMRTADSSLGTSSDQSLGGSLVDSQTISTSVEQVSTATDSGSTEPNSEFEDFIDLSVTNKNFEVKAQQSLFAHQTTDDLLNLNTNSIDNSLDNISSESHPKPLIAFEDNAARRQEVTDFLS